MNTFSSTENSGLLKNDYLPDSGLQAALKKRRQKLAETKIGLESEEDKEKENAGQ